MYPFQATPKAIDNSTQNPSVLDNQWPNQSVYQNVDLEKVDWAALAQHWIHMKETCPNDEPAPEAPPPPNISRPDVRDLEEQGEAPMEVVRDDDVMENDTNLPTFPIQGAALDLEPPNWNNAMPDQQNQRQWQKKTPGWNTWTNPNVPNQPKAIRPPLLNDPFTTATPVYSIKQDGFWSTNSNSSLGTSNSFDHSPQLNETNKSGTPLANIDITPSPLDAAQRKTLPAWIREGLEKMEKEKQREADRVREARQREERLKQEKLRNDLNSNQSSGTFDSEPSAYVMKSKFESDSDDSDSDGDQLDSSNVQLNIKHSPSKSPPVMLKPHRTKSEILQDIMSMVRTNLTEILLEVTNEEIKSIANETLAKIRSRGRKAQTVQKKAISGIGLGLVTYDDSDGGRSSSDSEDEEADSPKADNVDSEAELRETIERRKQAFEAKTEDIEAFLAEKEDKERQWLNDDDEIPINESKTGNNEDVNKNSNEMESGEVQQENNKFSSTSGRKQHERKASRFTDAKHLLYSVPPSIQLNNATNMYSRLNSTDGQPLKKETEKTVRDDNERDSDTSSRSSSMVSHSRHSKSHRSDRRDDGKYHKRSRRRSSSSSERSYSSRQSKSSHRHTTRGRSHRDRSRSRERSRYSRSSSRGKRDRHSRDKGYNRSHSYRKSRSRSRSHDSRSNKHKRR